MNRLWIKGENVGVNPNRFKVVAHVSDSGAF